MREIGIEADVAVAGAGAAGCTVARELAAAGRSVVLVEKGGDSTRFFGTPLGILSRIETEPSLNIVRRTVEGDDLIMARGVGGGTLVYAAAAFEPDPGYWQRHGVDIPGDLVREAVRECRVGKTPDEFIGEGTRRLWDAARETGQPWEKLDRFVDFERCKPGCDVCTEGCPCGAKWTARSFAVEAVEHGARLLARTSVERIRVEDGTAVGLVARRGGRRYEIAVRAVVCSAGAVATASLLGGCGIEGAGSWLFGDPTVISVGFLRSGKGNGREHSMPVGWHDRDRGLAFAACIQPAAAWRVQMVQGLGLRSLGLLHRFPRAMGVLCKVADECVGGVGERGRVSKRFTDRDRARRVHGIAEAERILVRAGCDPGTIVHGRETLGHPGGTVRVGRLLDTNLETPIRNLYCCDTSVLPEAPGIPPALTLVVLAKRLARRLEAVL